MTLEEIRSAVMATIDSSWATCTVIDHPNQPFTQPANAAWIRPRIKMGPSFYGELGETGVGLRTGVLFIEIFVPAGSGTKTGSLLCARAEAIVRRKDLSGVRFDEPSSDYVGIDEATGAARFLLTCDLNTWINP